MATLLPKNENEEIFLQGLDFCIEREFLTSEDKETAIQAGGITNEQWEKIRTGLSMATDGILARPLVFAVTLKKIDRELIHPDHSNFKDGAQVFPV